jgi:hypothetical protein
LSSSLGSLALLAALGLVSEGVVAQAPKAPAAKAAPKAPAAKPAKPAAPAAKPAAPAAKPAAPAAPPKAAPAPPKAPAPAKAPPPAPPKAGGASPPPTPAPPAGPIAPLDPDGSRPAPPATPTAAPAPPPPPPKPVEGVPVYEADPKQKADAQREFLTAKNALGQKKLDQALEGFRKSYAIVASPNSRLMIGRTLAQLGRRADAYYELKETVALAERAARRDKRYEKAVAAARAELDELRARIGLLTITVTGEAPNPRVMVSGKPLPKDKWGEAVPVDPGNHNVMLMSDWGNESRVVRVDPGAELDVTIGPEQFAAKRKQPDKVVEPEPESKSFGEMITPQNTQEIIAYVLAGAGTVALVNFAVFGALANGKFSDLESECNEGGECPASLQGDADDGRTFQTVANVSAIGGALLFTAGVTLFVMSRTSSDREEEPPASTPESAKAKAARAPELLVGPTGVLLRGKF